MRRVFEHFRGFAGSWTAMGLCMIGCSGTGAPAAPPPESPRPAVSWAGERAALEKRITELESRLALLEVEARDRRRGSGKLQETVRIGAAREKGSDAPPEAEGTAVPVVTLHERRVPPPLVIPEAPAGVSTTLAVVPLPGEPGESPASVRDRYRAALSLLREQRYDDALAAFADFIERYPDHALSAHAVYWRGEAHYARRAYASAMEAFEAVVTRYPRSNKVAHSILKVGLCHRRLGDEAAAQVWFSRVRAEYPESDAAKAVPEESSS